MSFSEMIDKVLVDRTKDIQLGLIATIETFDKSKMRADVKPLLKLKNDLDEEIELPVLPDLPVRFEIGGGFFIRPVYTKGDLVWIGFATHDIENALQEYTRAASKKIFEIHNACVMGGIMKDNPTIPSAFSEAGLIVGDSTYTINLTGSSLKLTDGTYDIEFDGSNLNITDGSLQIQFDGAAIIIGDPLAIHLKIDTIGIHAVTAPGVQFNIITHTHIGNLGAPTAPPTPGS